MTSCMMTGGRKVLSQVWRMMVDLVARLILFGSFVTSSLGCDQNFTASIGEIQSPNFPWPPSSRTRTVCKYEIKAPVGRRIQFTFHSHPHVVYGYGCYYGNVSIFEGGTTDLAISTPAETYCNTRDTFHKSYFSNGNSLLLVYDSSHGHTSFRFNVQYRFTLGLNMVFSNTEGMIYSPNFMNKQLNISQTYTYRIEADVGSRIYLAMSYINFYQDNNCSVTSLSIYEGTNTNGAPTERRCDGNITDFLSVSSVVSLRYSTKASSIPGDHGFIVFYASGAHGCSKFYNSSSGTIYSPLYPSKYPHNTICNYNITVQNGEAIYLVHSGSWFSVEDTLELFERDPSSGRLLRYAYGISYGHYSLSNSVLLKFKSDSADSTYGFTHEFRATKGHSITIRKLKNHIYSPSYPTNYPNNFIGNYTLILPKSMSGAALIYFYDVGIEESESCEKDSLSIYDGKDANAVLIDRICGQMGWKYYLASGKTLFLQLKTNHAVSNRGFHAYLYYCHSTSNYCNHNSNLHGRTFSPNYPRRYPHDTSYQQQISSSYGNSITLKMLYFDLERSENCTKDSLKIYENSISDKTLMSTRCGNDTTEYISTSNLIYLLFTSDSDVERTGYRIQYERCGGGFVGSNYFTIKSPRYPKNYTGNLLCRYYVHGLFPEIGVRLVFKEFDIEDSHGCQNDNFTIYEGRTTSSATMADVKCGRVSGDFFSKSQNLIIIFKSNSVINSKGFSIDVDYCSQLFTNETGTITSFYWQSLMYYRRMSCTYLIRLQKGFSIHVNFQHFSILEHEGNHVKIYDGQTTSAPLIATLRGSTYQNVSSNGNEMLIEFVPFWSRRYLFYFHFHRYYYRNFLNNLVFGRYGFILKYYGKQERKQPCPKNYNSVNGFTPNCTETHPQIFGSPRVYPEVEVNRLMFKCEFKSSTEEEVARFHVSWYEESPVKKLSQLSVLKGKERVAKLEMPLNPSYAGSEFRLGKAIFCTVYGWYEDRPYGRINGPEKESNHFFAGIKVEPRRHVHIVSESGSPLNLTVSATVPIVCNTGDSCSVLVQMTTDSSEVLLSVCMLEFLRSAANQSQIVQVAAKKDFLLDGSHTVKLHLHISKRGDSVGWNGHRTIPDVSIKTVDKDSGICQSTGDPHITTFDGLYFDHYKVGTYLLTKSNCRNFEVHVRTHKCSTVSCNCGVAAREDNDVIVVDFCRGAVETVRFASKGIPANGTKMMRDRTGKNFLIQFPSGSSVRFKLHPFVGTYYANIVVQVPGDDFYCTTGLCGTFDNNQANDMTDTYGKAHSYLMHRIASTAFTESYLVDSTDNLFSYTDTGHVIKPSVSLCSCAVHSLNTSNATCTYRASQRNYLEKIEGWVELVHPNAEARNRGGSNPTIVLPSIEDDVNYKFEPERPTETVPDWPTPSGRTKLQVETHCNERIRNSASGKICAIIPSLTFDQFVQQCVTDIQVTDTDDFTKSAIQSMQFACEEIFTKNMSYWKPNPENNGTLQPPTDLRNNLCPGLCSDNGVCVKSTCKCNDPYTGDDCSIYKKTPPKVDPVGFDTLCDIRNRSNCHLVRIRGSGFLENKNLACRITKLKISEQSYSRTVETRSYKANLLSFQEISCDIGSHSVTTDKHSDRSPSDGYIIEVTNDGVTFSKAKLAYVIYDSKCMECNWKDSTCKQKETTCIISGLCTLDGESNGNIKCDAKAKIGASTDTNSAQRVTLIAVGSGISVVFILAIVMLVGLRNRQRKNTTESEVGSEAAKALELGRVNVVGADEDFGSKTECKDSGKVSKKSHEIEVIFRKSDGGKEEDAVQCASENGRVSRPGEDYKEDVFLVKILVTGEDVKVKAVDVLKPVNVKEMDRDQHCIYEEIPMKSEAETLHDCSSMNKPDPAQESEPYYVNLMEMKNSHVVSAT